MTPDPPSRREAVLALLRGAAEPRSILELAEALRVHPNTVRFHLDALCRTGQVEQLVADAVGPGRPPALFRATHRMDPNGPTNYRFLATVLTHHLAESSPHAAATAADLGRAWGAHLVDPTSQEPARTPRRRRAAALARLTGVLAELGFAPEPPSGPQDASIRLRHCPFLDLVTDGPVRAEAAADTGGDVSPTRAGGVICSLHLGLMQGAFGALDSPVTVDRLEPFVQPDLCVARLAASSAAPPAGPPLRTPKKARR